MASITVGQHDEGVVVEQVRDRVLVVGQVLLVGGADVLVDVLQLDEQERQAVDEADDVGAAAVEIARTHSSRTRGSGCCSGSVEVEDPQPLLDQLALVVAKGDLHAVLQQGVFLPVGGEQGLRRRSCRRSAGWRRGRRRRAGRG